MSKKALTAEEMRLKGLAMIRQAKEKERASQMAIRVKLGELVEQYLADDGFRSFDLKQFLTRVATITGQPLPSTLSSVEKR
jgi:hypothetical protein